MKPPLRLSPLSEERLDELKELYRTTKDVRLRTRSQMILLAAEQGMTAPAIARLCGGVTRRCGTGSSVTKLRELKD